MKSNRIFAFFAGLFGVIGAGLAFVGLAAFSALVKVVRMTGNSLRSLIGSGSGDIAEGKHLVQAKTYGLTQRQRTAPTVRDTWRLCPSI